MSNCCPNCGFNLTADQIVERDGFTLDPRGSIMKDGVVLALAPKMKLLLHSLAAEGGRICSDEFLRGRIGSDSFDSDLMHVHVSLTRKALRKQNVEPPIQSVYGMGYRWRSPGQQERTTAVSRIAA